MRFAKAGRLGPIITALVLASCSDDCGIPGTAYVQCSYRYSDDMKPIRIQLTHPRVTVPSFEVPRAYVAIVDDWGLRHGTPKSITTGFAGLLFSLPDLVPLKIARRKNQNAQYAMVHLSSTIGGRLEHYTAEGSSCRKRGHASVGYSDSASYSQKITCDGSDYLYAGTSQWPRSIVCMSRENVKPIKCKFEMRIAENMIADIAVPHPRLSGSVDETERVGLTVVKKLCSYIACNSEALSLGGL